MVCYQSPVQAKTDSFHLNCLRCRNTHLEQRNAKNAIEHLKTPCVGKHTGLKKQYPTTHQCSRDILIIAQNYPFAIKK
ncbi:hypothetical protein HMPREF9470_01698 [[Clostridium] citroniae WAL-19142]|uniref:Uncharacterized protein n=2 Tax=Enterocloster citroniae TaxID=358743 RepID=A0ABV2G1U8_9FIRM|nr:hypothetical protein HMPREF9470_01698 [[Clostridium] citroniae WAL-19142]